MTQIFISTKLLPMVENAKHKAFGNRLTFLMETKNVGVSELSESIGVTYEMARRYKLGSAKPRPDKIEKIAALFGCTKSWLEHGEGDLHERVLENAINFDVREDRSSGYLQHPNGLSADAEKLIQLIKSCDQNKVSRELFSDFSSILSKVKSL